MTLNASNARIFGGDGDAVNLAPLGTTLPETIDEVLNAAFEDIGWLHSDGVTETASGSVEKSRGHQGNRVVRTRINEGGTTVAFTALETKALTQKLRYDEKTSSSTGGVRKTTRGAGQKITRMAAVLDFYDMDDDSVKERWIIPVLEIAPTGDRAMTNADIAGYPMSGEIIGDYIVLSTEAPSDAEGN